jgi:hypothetical protein
MEDLFERWGETKIYIEGQQGRIRSGQEAPRPLGKKGMGPLKSSHFPQLVGNP